MLTSLDILYVILAIGIALMSIFLSILLVYLIMILRDINKATEAIKDSAERVNEMILKPIRMAHEVLKYAKPVVDIVEEKIRERGEEKSRKKNNSKK
ncbi:MAG: hypothetical protein UT36_C0010G0067 [Candidatus Peregrinibacteria bacterium GW2011_GWF2_39_17]|nr:MAG: hypothetical protein UT36_C0010G0067 [Candidatus Peregrinibacteria bacterium GW2011_GWF2_39_17]HCW32313.1 hypothetical protein [Candidatus Peregrinibacteria bacterium]